MGDLFLIFYGFMMLACVSIMLWEVFTKRGSKKRNKVRAMSVTIQHQKQIIAHQQNQLRWYRNNDQY